MLRFEWVETVRWFTGEQWVTLLCVVSAAFAALRGSVR